MKDNNISEFAAAAEQRLREATGQADKGTSGEQSKPEMTPAEVRQANREAEEAITRDDRLVNVGRANQTTGRL